MKKLDIWVPKPQGERAIKRGIPCSVGAAATMVANCQLCAQLKQMPLSKTPMGKLYQENGSGQIWQIDCIGLLSKGGGRKAVCLYGGDGGC